MDWQTIAVVLVVAAAATFLVRRVSGARRRRPTSAQTFVPLERVRKRDDTCH